MVSMMIPFDALWVAVLLWHVYFMIQTIDLFYISNRSPKVCTPAWCIANGRRSFAYIETRFYQNRISYK